MTRDEVHKLIEDRVGSDDDYDMFSLARDMFTSKYVTDDEFKSFISHLSSILSETEYRCPVDYFWPWGAVKGAFEFGAIIPS